MNGITYGQALHALKQRNSCYNNEKLIIVRSWTLLPRLLSFVRRNSKARTAK